MNALFIELSKVLILTMGICIIARIFKQPLIIGYIFSGILAGPAFLNIMHSNSLAGFSQIGISLLLFMVGIHLNPKVIKEVGSVSSITGVLQMLVTTSVALLFLRLLGLPFTTAVYISISLTFSSTIIIMKLLSDKGELDKLYSKITIGVLILQDVVAMILLILISLFTSHSSLLQFGVLIIKWVITLLIFYLFSKYLLPLIVDYIAKSQEMLLLFSISWSFAISALFGYVGLSMESGALLAGIALSTLPYNEEISSKMKPIRDFFLILFFISLGTEMNLSAIGSNFWIILLLSFFIIIIKPLIVFFIMIFMNYTARTSFLAGLNLSQISEFSLIVLGIILKFHFISNDLFSTFVATGLISFVFSAYLIQYSNLIYIKFSGFLKRFERKNIKNKEQGKYESKKHYDIIIFGANRTGGDIIESLKKLNMNFLVVEYNPEIIRNLIKEGIDCLYGDANDVETLDKINFKNVRMIISTTQEIDTNQLLIDYIKNKNKNALIIMVANDVDDALTLYDLGANYVITPHLLAGKHAASLIEMHKFNKDAFLTERLAHILYLHKRKKERDAHGV